MQGDRGGDPPEDPTEPSVDGGPVEVERGRRYTLSVEDDTYNIWDDRAPDGPIASYSGDEAGMEAAVSEFERLERLHRGSAAAWLPALAIVFGVALVTWILGSAAGSLQYARETTGSVEFGGPTSGDWVVWIGTASSIALNVWVGALFALGFTWLYGRVAQGR